MFMFNWLRKPKIDLDPDAPKIGDFRIVPYQINEFIVEEYHRIYRGYGWSCPEYGSRSFHRPTWIGTEEQCEEYIQWRIEKVRKQKEYTEKVAAHVAANPPRRVPPFKHLKPSKDTDMNGCTW